MNGPGPVSASQVTRLKVPGKRLHQAAQLRRCCQDIVRSSGEKTGVFESSAPVLMRLVANDQVYFLVLKKLACRMSDVSLVSRHCQTIHDGPYTQVAELIVPVHGSREHDGPTTRSRAGIDDQAGKTRIACWIAESQDLAVSTGQEGIGVGGSLLDFVDLVSEVTDNGYVEPLFWAPHPKVL